LFKTTIIAAAAVATASANVNADFMSGFQTGAFIGDFSEFEDYSCPLPDVSDNVNKYLNMYNMAKNMMGMQGKKDNKTVVNKKNGNDMVEMVDKVDKYIDQLSVVASVMDLEYDGGDFCQGLTIGFEGRQVAQSMFVGALKGALSGNADKNDTWDRK